MSVTPLLTPDTVEERIAAINRGIDEHWETVDRDSKAAQERRKERQSGPSLSQVVEMLTQVLGELAQIRTATA